MKPLSFPPSEGSSSSPVVDGLAHLFFWTKPFTESASRPGDDSTNLLRAPSRRMPGNALRAMHMHRWTNAG
jgi:hypothetical protein